MLWGLDQLFAAKYADVAAREHPVGWLFGTFADVAGDALPICQRVGKEGRAAGQRIDLAWEDSHIYRPQNFPKIAAKAKRFASLVKKHPNKRWLFSGATEHKLSPFDAAKLAEMVMGNLPSSAEYVNNPWIGEGAFIPLVINEVHGAGANRPNIGGKFGYSCDGSDCFDFDIERQKVLMEGAEYFMFWTSQFNGRKTASDPTPRAQRRAFPGSQLIDATIYLSRDCGKVKLPAKYTLKPKSDQHTVPPAPRELKPVVIIPPKVDRIELIASNGQVVAASGKPQPFADGRWRYYFDQYGYSISEKAIRIHGSPIVSMRVGGRIVGTCNMAFRQGGFR